ncbi:SpoIIE family protein phosphatase, partial [Desulfococcaceae bacterium HSG8]|nr:SpoIIE family protein phosphatase [Desulfococcaceae bacterium HSG8]
GKIVGNYYVKNKEISKDDEKLCTLGVFISPAFMREKLRTETIRRVIIIIILNILLSLILFISIRKSVVFPVKGIAESVRIIASGNLDTTVSSQREDEIGQLSSDVEKMRLAIKDLTENLKEQEHLKKEMELARKIQTSLLPTLTESLHPDFEIAATMLPAEQVGGDFYDITLDRTGALWFAIGDVSGHGVTPGLIMMMAQTVQATVTTNLECDARGVVVKVNEILYMNVHERLKESHFMTFTALKHLGNGLFQHAGAHLSMIVFRHKTGACELVRTGGVYLNFKKDISRATKNREFSLDPGDILVLYTDGLTESLDPDGQMLDLGGFVKIVENHAHRIPEAMKDMIMADVIKWCDNNRADDMTLVIVRRKET